MTSNSIVTKNMKMLGLINVIGYCSFFIILSYLLRASKYLPIIQFISGLCLMPFFIVALFGWLAPEKSRSTLLFVSIYLTATPILGTLFMDFEIIYFAIIGIALGAITVMNKQPQKPLFAANILGLLLWIFLHLLLFIN